MEPILTIALAGGPIKTIPSFASFSENVAFSLRNPYLHLQRNSVLNMSLVMGIFIPWMYGLWKFTKSFS